MLKKPPELLKSGGGELQLLFKPQRATLYNTPTKSRIIAANEERHKITENKQERTPDDKIRDVLLQDG